METSMTFVNVLETMTSWSEKMPKSDNEKEIKNKRNMILLRFILFKFSTNIFKEAFSFSFLLQYYTLRGKLPRFAR